jgi:hypothetical protein
VANYSRRFWQEPSLYEDRGSEEIWPYRRRKAEEAQVTDKYEELAKEISEDATELSDPETPEDEKSEDARELERLESLERHANLTNASDQNALNALREGDE